MDFFLANTTLQVLTAAIIVGVALNFIKQRESIILFLGRLSKIVFTGLKYVMYLAPIGAFGGMAYTIGKFGLETLISARQTYAHRIHYHGAVHFCGFG
jgi:aerobic C4-dicarboxylate transport protein